jgi:hypothetical protein
MDMEGVGFSDPADKARWTDGEELQNIRDTENPYREERGLPKRNGHDDIP